MNAHTNEYIQKKGIRYQIPGWCMVPCQGGLDNLNHTKNSPENTTKVDDDE